MSGLISQVLAHIANIYNLIIRLFGKSTSFFIVVVTSVYFFIEYLYTFMVDAIDRVVIKLGDLITSLTGNMIDYQIDFSPIQEYYEFANFFIPLDQLLVAISGIFLWLTLCVTIRVIKAFVPTIA
jgi:hypothetical protein